jgi:OFA family oxalate/formate antiporter-like MFS transporter
MGLRLGGEGTAGASRVSRLENPWIQLAAGIVGMVAVANLQYGWTLFVGPLQDRFGWDKALIQITFTLFVLAQSWLVPVEGYLVDNQGPRRVVLVGGVLVGLAWLINSRADSLPLFYAAGIIGGIGAGIVYGTSIGNALKWFPYRRGLAAGLTAAAFGGGAALSLFPIKHVIHEFGYQSAFFWFGLGQGGAVLLCALILRAPGAAPTGPRSGRAMVGRDYTWRETLRCPAFWLMYVMLVMVTTGGLMAIAQLAPMAADFGVADQPVTVLGRTVAALTLALALEQICSGLTRPIFGWISDYLGRENTMFLAFGLEGLAILLLINLAHVPALFVVLTGLTFFAWGEIYSLFPALCGDLFGRKFATTNYGLLYTGKGMAALLVPLGSLVQKTTGSWKPVFQTAIAFDWTAALLALLVLKPLCRRLREKK